MVDASLMNVRIIYWIKGGEAIQRKRILDEVGGLDIRIG